MEEKRAKIFVDPATSNYDRLDPWARLLKKTVEQQGHIAAMTEENGLCTLAYQPADTQQVFLNQGKTWREVFEIEFKDILCRSLEEELWMLTGTELQLIVNTYYKGKRIRCKHMDDPYHPVPDGTEGTILYADDMGDIHVAWDTRSSLALVPEADRFCFVS